MKRFSIPQFNAVEVATICYLLITGAFVGFNYQVIENFWVHLLARLLMLAIIYFIAKKRENGIAKPILAFLSEAYPLVFLSYLYPETDALNNVFYQNVDMAFVFFEYSIFG
ncbi:MAG TPA: hypothetical protein VIN10_11615, partial [Bacteroidales bacterium]